MLKTHKKVIFSLLGLTSVAAIVVPLVTSCATKSVSNPISNNDNMITNLSNEKDFAYLYDDKVFANLDKIVTYFINKDPSSVQDKLYLGNINDAILDPSSLLLDINDLQPYDPNRMYPVYLNALNIPTYDYESAKKSYVNKGLIDYQYYDFNNNLFPTYDEAKQSIINSKNPLGVMYYNNINVNANKTINFNPLSKTDLFNFKKIAFDQALMNSNSNFK